MTDDTIEVKDVTEEICCLGIFGPKSREMIQKLSTDDFLQKISNLALENM